MWRVNNLKVGRAGRARVVKGVSNPRAKLTWLSNMLNLLGNL